MDGCRRSKANGARQGGMREHGIVAEECSGHSMRSRPGLVRHFFVPCHEADVAFLGSLGEACLLGGVLASPAEQRGRNPPRMRLRVWMLHSTVALQRAPDRVNAKKGSGEREENGMQRGVGQHETCYHDSNVVPPGSGGMACSRRRRAGKGTEVGDEHHLRQRRRRRPRRGRTEVN